MISFIIEVIPASLIKPFKWRTHSHDITTNDTCCLIRETLTPYLPESMGYSIHNY